MLTIRPLFGFLTSGAAFWSAEDAKNVSFIRFLGTFDGHIRTRKPIKRDACVVHQMSSDPVAALHLGCGLVTLGCEATSI